MTTAATASIPTNLNPSGLLDAAPTPHTHAPHSHAPIHPYICTHTHLHTPTRVYTPTCTWHAQQCIMVHLLFQMQPSGGLPAVGLQHAAISAVIKASYATTHKTKNVRHTPPGPFNESAGSSLRSLVRHKICTNMGTRAINSTGRQASGIRALAENSRFGRQPSGRPQASGVLGASGVRFGHGPQGAKAPILKGGSRCNSRHAGAGDAYTSGRHVGHVPADPPRAG